MLEGPILAVSRQTSSVAGIPGASQRYSFAKIDAPIEVPGLLDLQRESFAWLVGSPQWRANAQAEAGEGASICRCVWGVSIYYGALGVFAEIHRTRLGTAGRQIVLKVQSDRSTIYH